MIVLRYGLVLPIQARDTDLTRLWEELLEEVTAAEEAGFDACFLPEFHQARGGALVSPMVLGAALLQATTRIRFGPCVLALPLHHPVRLAEDVVMLDWTSGGRVLLGVGVGHQAPDFGAFGVPYGQRHLVFEEALQILERCFASEPFRHEGRWFTLDAQVTPAPRTRPRPPVWIGAHSAAGLERAARYGDCWVADPQRDVDTLSVLAKRYREAASAAGKQPAVALFREAWVGDSRAECEREWAPHALAMHRLYFNVGAYRRRFEPWVDEVHDRADFTLGRVGPGRFLYGAPEDVRAEAASWAEATGASYLAVRLRHPGGPSHERVLEAIRRFGAEVIP